MSRKTILFVLQNAWPRYLTVEAIARFANETLPHPISPDYVRAEMALLESKGFVQRKASVLDPEELTWAVTEAGKEVSTL